MSGSTFCLSTKQTCIKIHMCSYWVVYLLLNRSLIVDHCSGSNGELPGFVYIYIQTSRWITQILSAWVFNTSLFLLSAYIYIHISPTIRNDQWSPLLIAVWRNYQLMWTHFLDCWQKNCCHTQEVQQILSEDWKY